MWNKTHTELDALMALPVKGHDGSQLVIVSVNKLTDMRNQLIDMQNTIVTLQASADPGIVSMLYASDFRPNVRPNIVKSAKERYDALCLAGQYRSMLDAQGATNAALAAENARLKAELAAQITLPA